MNYSTVGDAPRARQHLTLHGGEAKNLMAAQELAVQNARNLIYRSLNSRKTANGTHGRLFFQNRVFTKVSGCQHGLSVVY